VLFTPLGTISSLPEWMFDPAGVMALLPPGFWAWFSAPGALLAFKMLLLLFLAGVIVSRRPGPLLLVPAALGVFLYDGYLHAWGGFLNHARFGILYLALFFAVASFGAWKNAETPAGRAPEPVSREEAVLRLAALLLSIPYLLIGLHRFIVGGTEVFLGDALQIQFELRTLETGSFPLTLGWWLAQQPVLMLAAKVGYFLTTVAEVLTPFAVFHRRLRLAWIGIMVPFHLMTGLTMNILFWDNLVLIAVLFTALPVRLEQRWEGREGPLPGRRPRPGADPGAGSNPGGPVPPRQPTRAGA
jgi:hypothetical protein